MTKFRISAKKLLLTYSQVNSEMTHTELLHQLQNKTNLHDFKYVICKEHHIDKETHFHVVLIHHEKFEIFSSNTLDIEYQQKVFHGNYTPVRSLQRAIAYVCKTNDYITNLENLHDGKLLTAKEFIIKEVQEKGIEKALIDHYQRSPEKAIAGTSVSSLKKQFNDIEKLKLTLQLDNVDTPFGLDNFDIQAQLKQWTQNPNKTLVLVGDSGIGKTQFCKAFVKQKNLKTLIVNNKEDFRRLNLTYDALIIDDANIHEFEETQLLSIIDNQVNKTIRVLYDSVVKKANIIQMIAMNVREFNKVSFYLSQPRFARRLLLHKPEKPFIVNVNIQNLNITNNSINIHSNSTNNNVNMEPNNFKKHQEDEQRHIVETQKLIYDISTGKI